MQMKPIIDVLEVVWFLAFCYIAALAFLFGLFQKNDPLAIASLVALIPSLGWTTWRIARGEGYFTEPTAKQTIFLGCLLGLLAVAQYIDVAAAIERLF